MKRFASVQLTILLYVAHIIGLRSSSLPQDEIYALTRFKEFISEDSTHALLNWSRVGIDPCDWPSITCYVARDHVQSLNISWASLKGFIAPELGKLSHLQDLILHGNMLTGTIPKEFGSLKYLKVLDLGMNQLTGSIPTELWSLTNLENINLQSNGLTGNLPTELTRLKHLTELRLDRNRLQGSIPGSNPSDSTENVDGKSASNLNAADSCCPSQLKVADFSFNFFTGSVIKCLDCLPRTNFQGNCLQDKNVKQRPPAQCVAPPNSRSQPLVAKNPSPQSATKHREASRPASASKPTWILAVEIITGAMAGSIFLVALLTAGLRYKNKSSNIIHWKKSASDMDHLAIYIDTEMLKDVMKFSRQELEVACEDFSNIIGSSQDSQVYKGTLKGGPEIAVISICIKEDHWASYLELYFQREVAELARLNHENIGKLLGYCSENSPFTRMLVFEYASNGTLYEHLHYGEGCQFSWTRRMKIIIGIAKGLKYLHNGIDLPFTISELNSTAVYLTDDFSPKLVDFESWKSILSSSDNSGPVCLLPNSLEARYLNVEGNVYAFGILLLEIISGKPPNCQDKLHLVDWAKDDMKKPEMMSHLVDPEIKYFKQEDLEIVCEAVNRCIHPDPSKRASMGELCSLLESKIDTSVSAELQSSSLAWAELALSSDEFHS